MSRAVRGLVRTFQSVKTVSSVPRLVSRFVGRYAAFPAIYRPQVIPIEDLRFSGVRFFSSSAQPVRCPECETEMPSEGSRYSFFCAECLSILPVDRSKNYFQVLNTTPSYDVDSRAIAVFKRHLMKKLHPDKFAGSDPAVIKLAEDQSSLINEAASVLTNPYKRGLYLLQINGLEIEEGTNPDLGNEFLMDLMELNEEAEAATDARDVDKLLKQVQRVIGSMERELSEAFTGGCFASSTYTTFDLAEAKVILEKIKFYINLEDLLREKMTVV